MLLQCLSKFGSSCFVTALFAVGLSIHGATAQTLDDALASAYANNPTLAGQRAALRATDELIPQARSGFRPSFNIQASTTRNDESVLDSNTGSLTFAQNIYRGGADLANLGRAEILIRVERARLLATEQDILLDAVSAYTNLLNDAAVLALAFDRIERLEQQLSGIRGRFAIGEVAQTDIAQAEASLAAAIAVKDQAAGTLETSRANYLAVVREPPSDALIPPRPIEILMASVEEVEAMALDLNPNVHAARANLLAAEQDVRVAAAALLPQIDIQGSIDRSQRIEFDVTDRSASITAQINVPLFQGGAEYSTIRQNEDTVDQRKADLEAVRTSVRLEATSAWQALKTARSNVASITEQIRAANIALEGSRQEALLGERSTLDVLDQEAALFQAEVDLVGAQRDEIVASYQLIAAVGRLTADQLRLDTDQYDPIEHYDSVKNR